MTRRGDSKWVVAQPKKKSLRFPWRLGRHVLFSRQALKYITSLLFYCSFFKKTHKRKQDFLVASPVPSQWTILNISNYIVIMCTSSEQTLGKCAPSMAQTIISKCRRTWGRELRIGVLHRTLEPRLSVWDCVPENIIDAHLKDAVYEARFG